MRCGGGGREGEKKGRWEGREEGREGRREREGGREGSKEGRKRERGGGGEGERKGGRQREGGREGKREPGREGGNKRENYSILTKTTCVQTCSISLRPAFGQQGVGLPPKYQEQEKQSFRSDMNLSNNR